MIQTLRHGWRSWKSAKGVALLAALALAAGIGSTTAIFTVAESVLLKPLPYVHGDRMVNIFGARFSEPGEFSSLSLPDLADFRNRTYSFDVFGVYAPTNFNLTAPGPPLYLTGVSVSPGLVRELGVNPIKGRWFEDEAREHGNADLAVISKALWTRLGQNPNVVGSVLTLNNRAYTVTGVMPGWFRLPIGGPGGEEVRADVWTPLRFPVAGGARGYAAYFCYARLKPGVTVAAADADVKRAAAEIAREFPVEHAGFTALAVSLKQTLAKNVRPTLLLLLGAAVALLLITCANVAGLLLARSVARARETAARVALGASRGQLAVQFFVEGLMLSLAGGVGGVAVSYALLRFVLRVAADEIPRADEIGLDWMALAFALGVAVLASVLFSLAPLWQASRILPNDVLTEGIRATASARSRKLSRSLVVSEIALAFALVAGAAILVARFAGLTHVAPGFDPEHVMTFQMTASATDYPDLDRLSDYQARLVRALQRSPGVTAAGFANQLPLAGCCYSFDIYPEGMTQKPGDMQTVSYSVTSPGYFDAMRIPLERGRIYNARDLASNHDDVAVIDDATARKYWPGRDPVGAYAHASSPDGSRFRIIGVTGSVKNRALNLPTVPEVFFPNTLATLNTMLFVVRSPLEESALLAEIRAAVAGVNARQPIYQIAAMRQIVQNSIAQQRLQSVLVAFFASAAVLMAAIGIYGVISYSIRQRTSEIGTRMALGATSGDLFRLILGDGFKMTLAGILLGAALAVAATLAPLPVEGVRAGQPLPLLFAAAVIASITAAACFFPAWRATLLSPMVAIRSDTVSFWRDTREGLRRMRLARTRDDENAAIAESELLAEIADTGRLAATFPEALEGALARLRDRIQAGSMELFVQKSADQPYRCAARIPAEGRDWTIPADSLLVSRLRHYAGALPIGPGDLASSARWAKEYAPRHAPEIETIQQLGASLAARVAVRNEISGLLLAGSPGARPYSELDRRLVRGVAAQIATMLEISRLTDRVAEQDRLRRELLLAGEVQKRLFPESSPRTEHLRLAGVCIPARGVGGDYYDFLDLGEGHIGIALADVAGKGIAAALIMSVVQASLRSLTGLPGQSLGELAARINRLLHRSTGASSYATFFYAEVDERGRSMRYVNGGHNPPYLLRSDGQIEELPAGGTIIGMFAQSAYEEATLRLRSGDVFLAFTDGVPEALDPNDEEFGEERLKATLRSVRDLAVEQMAARLLAELKTWIGDAAQYDDLTFILMKVN